MIKRVVCTAIAAFALSACSSSSTPQVGETWYVQDHAYTDAVYRQILQTGTDTWPAQTNESEPDRSYHLLHPFPCKISEQGDDGFYRCDIDSGGTLSVTSVWTNRLMTHDQAEVAAPGTVVHKPVTDNGKPSWLVLRAGQQAFLGDDGGSAVTASICSSPAAWRDFSSGGDAVCMKKPRGTPVTIISFVHDYNTDPSGKVDEPIVQVQATDHSWQGWTAAMVDLQPRIPSGTQVVLETLGNADVYLAPKQDADLNAGTLLKGQTLVTIIKQDTKTEDRDLYVRVASGPHVGERGWVFSLDGQTRIGGGIGFAL